jgi:hypothetical protein
MKTTLLIVGFILLVDGVAHAQVTQIQPNGLGGYNVYTPGQFPTQVTPNGIGGYNVYAPPAQAPVYSPPAYFPPPALGAGLPGSPPAGYQPPVAAGMQMYGR